MDFIPTEIKYQIILHCNLDFVKLLKLRIINQEWKYVIEDIIDNMDKVYEFDLIHAKTREEIVTEGVLRSLFMNVIIEQEIITEISRAVKIIGGNEPGILKRCYLLILLGGHVKVAKWIKEYMPVEEECSDAINIILDRAFGNGNTEMILYILSDPHMSKQLDLNSLRRLTLNTLYSLINCQPKKN